MAKKLIFVLMIFLLISIAKAGDVATEPYCIDDNTLFLCHFDGSLDCIATGNDSPQRSEGVEYVNGKFGDGILLDDDSDVLTYSTYGNLLPDKGTIEMWIKPKWSAPNSDVHYFFHHYIDTSNKNRIMLNYQGLSGIYFKVFDSDGSGKEVNKSITWSSNEWHHIAASWGDSDSSMHLYIDGVEVDTRDEGRKASSLTDIFGIGSGHAGDGWFPPPNTVIDELRISNIKRTSFSNNCGSQTTTTTTTISATTSSSTSSTSTTIPECGSHCDMSFCHFPNCICQAEKGDCDLDIDCGQDLICCDDVGDFYGCVKSTDICLSQERCNELSSANTTTTTTTTTIAETGECPYSCVDECEDDFTGTFCYDKTIHDRYFCENNKICCELISVDCPLATTTTTTLQECPYECCVSGEYQQKLCENDRVCCDNVCKESCIEKKGSNLFLWLVVAIAIPIVVFLVYNFGIKKVGV